MRKNGSRPKFHYFFFLWASSRRISLVFSEKSSPSLPHPPELTILREERRGEKREKDKKARLSLLFSVCLVSAHHSTSFIGFSLVLFLLWLASVCASPLSQLMLRMPGTFSTATPSCVLLQSFSTILSLQTSPSYLVSDGSCHSCLCSQAKPLHVPFLFPSLMFTTFGVHPR